jgi:hypothetical protein
MGTRANPNRLRDSRASCRALQVRRLRRHKAVVRNLPRLVEDLLRGVRHMPVQLTTVEVSKPVLTCRDTGLTDEDASILMRNLRRAFIGQRDDQLAYEQARYQVKTRAWRNAKRLKSDEQENSNVR